NGTRGATWFETALTRLLTMRDGQLAQFSVSHTRLPSWLQVLQCAGWLKVLASCHSCASLLHCAVAWQMTSSEPQATQTGVERAARFVTFRSIGCGRSWGTRSWGTRSWGISNGLISLARRNIGPLHLS